MNTPRITPRSGQPVQVIVSADLYSGRENPNWVLTSGDADKLVAKLSTLKLVPSEEMPNPLGYRGFVIEMQDGEQGGREGRIVKLRVFGGVVERTSPTGEVAFFEDKNRACEAWLFESAVPHISQDEINLIRRALQQRTP